MQQRLIRALIFAQPQDRQRKQLTVVSSHQTC
jgi:hypothetical protein